MGRWGGVGCVKLGEVFVQVRKTGAATGGTGGDQGQDDRVNCPSGKPQ